MKPLAESLNRTMQYGNEILKPDEQQKNIKFKSHYVVWKQ